MRKNHKVTLAKKRKNGTNLQSVISPGVGGFRASNTFYRMLVESLDGYGVFTTDKKGNINSWNKGSEFIFGYTEAEMIGKNVSSIFTPEDRKNFVVRKELAQVLKKGSVINERYHLKKDGTRIWVTGLIFLLEDADRVLQGYTFVLRDQDEQKQIEKRKDDFISTATHELRTPVTSMKLFAEIVAVNAKKKKDTVTLKSVEELNKQLDRLVSLMDYLLDVSKIQQGRLKLKKTYFNINKVIEELLRTIQFVSPSHLITQEGAAKKMVFADKERIIQVLTNLLTNAIKYSPKGGKVVVMSEQSSSTTQVGVKDFGFGIAHHEQVAVFDRFYRAKGATDSKINGIGLGLYVVQKIIHAHRGKVWVKSESNKGSTFYFSLPQKREVVFL